MGDREEMMHFAHVDSTVMCNSVPDEMTQRLAMAKAVKLLTHREYSEQELNQRLSGEFPDEVVASVVGLCVARDWLNERRMTVSFVRSHAVRGQGPRKIRAELRIKGIAEFAIEEALTGYDWFELARQTARRKSQQPWTLDRLALQRLHGFLIRRGFTVEQAYYGCAADSDC